MLVFIGVLLAIAVGFSIPAFRLITGRGRESELMSPILLRLWGSFFLVGSALVLIESLIRRRTGAIAGSLELLISGVSMAVAAFVLAARRERATRRTHERFP
jgi:hypothetical protein